MSLVFCEHCGYSLRPDASGDCPACRRHLIDPGDYRNLQEERRRETEVESFGFALEGPGVDPWFAIFTRPRKAIREVLVNGPVWPALLLAAVGGICGFLSDARLESLGNGLRFDVILIVACIFGPLVGLASLYVLGACLFLTGRVLGGRAPAPDVRLALGWSSALTLPELLIWGIGILVIGPELFTSATPRVNASATLQAVSAASLVLELALGVGFLVVLAISLSEVQRFGIWRSLASLLLASALFCGLLVGLGLLVQYVWSSLAVF